MDHATRLLLSVPVTAIKLDEQTGEHGIITSLPVGAHLEIQGQARLKTDEPMIEVLCEGKRYAAFLQDLEGAWRPN